MRWQQTPRDRQILAALDLCPLEAADMLQLSETFTQPFTSLRRVQERLKVLSAARQVSSWRYATTGESGGKHFQSRVLGDRRQSLETLPPAIALRWERVHASSST